MLMKQMLHIVQIPIPAMTGFYWKMQVWYFYLRPAIGKVLL